MTEREAALEAENKRLQIKVAELQERIDQLCRKVFGASSEKLDANQLMLLEAEAKKDEAPAAVEPVPGAASRRSTRKPRRPRMPEHLPVEEEIIEPPEVEADPDAWRRIGEEVSEQLDFLPGKFIKRRRVRPKYVHKDNPFAPPVIAPLPPGLQERCLAAPGLIAEVITAKYVDHLPLYRQEQIYRQRYGVDIPRQSLCRWVEMAADLFQLIYHQIAREQWGNRYLQIDETPIRYLDPGAGKAPQGYFWTTAVPAGDVVYHWHPGRGADCLDTIIPADFTGTLQCDGYKAYPSFCKGRDGPIELAGCWAHVRRKFVESRERAPRMAGWILNQIGQLYGIERRLRDGLAGPRLRAAVRASESAPVLRRLHRLLRQLQSSHRYLPKSNMGKAIAYALDQWPRLEVFLGDGLIEIDNNGVENAIRPTAVGKKNWLFFGSETSGTSSAILFTLIESAKRHGLDPHAYISYLLHALPAATNFQIPQMTPAAYAKSLQNKAA
jgi:transposase